MNPAMMTGLFKMMGVNPDEIKKQVAEAGANFARIEKEFHGELKTIDEKLNLLLNHYGIPTPSYQPLIESVTHESGTDSERTGG